MRNALHDTSRLCAPTVAGGQFSADLRLWLHEWLCSEFFRAAYYEQGNYMAAANEFHKAAMTDPANPDYMANSHAVATGLVITAGRSRSTGRL